MLRKENRGTDLIDDAENQEVASRHVRPNVHQEDSLHVVEILHLAGECQRSSPLNHLRVFLHGETIA